MFSWLQKDIPIAASVLFPTAWPSKKEEFERLRGQGIEVIDRETPENGLWALKLKHPQWGEAVLMCLRDLSLPSAQMVEWDAFLSADEKAAVKASNNSINLMVNSRQNNLLRDRKNALFFLNAVVGPDGVGAVDHLSGRIWSRAALNAEASHNAEADIQSLFTVHYIVGEAPLPEDADELEEPEKTGWLHTHGLSEIGLFDFDIINPGQSVLRGDDVIRAVAFAILEGKLKRGASDELISKIGPIWAVPARDFMAKARPEWSRIRNDPAGEHVEDRVVLCEMAPPKFFGGIPAQVRPSKSLMETFPEGRAPRFSKEASELMAERTRTAKS